MARDCVSHPKLNRLLRGLSDEEEELAGQRGADGWIPSRQANRERTTQRAALWSTCVEQSLIQDLRTEMSMALTTVLPNDQYFAMPFMVSARAQN